MITKQKARKLKKDIYPTGFKPPKVIANSEQGGHPKESYEKKPPKLEWVSQESAVQVQLLREIRDLLKQIRDK